ncbi:glycosyltransferase [Salinimicrobium terrae]|uniref:glycosyltransferase n=1 Tax=Salinimicrobium terrae TaxID=470866 RepID=UPI0003FAB7E2|nr:glycosyltransferase [Salinimicrobium terrae]
MIATAVIITLLYSLAMLFLLYGFSKASYFCGKNSAPKTTFSIVIPYRNEAENLPLLFKSLLKLRYPLEMFEIIAVDDASEDSSAESWEEFRKGNPQFNIRLLQNFRKSGSPKKDAIELAVSTSNNEYILTTDADCEVPQFWLQKYNSFISETNAIAVAAPVAVKYTGAKMTFLKRFQELDIFSLQAATIGGFGVNQPFMCNGANFCYSKMAFLIVNGFQGNNEIASGDDIFLLEKFQEKGFKTAFLKSPVAVVSTAPNFSWKQLFFQRVRWAAKTSAYKSFYSRGLGVLVLLMNVLILFLFIFVLLDLAQPLLLLVIFLLKVLLDFLLIYSSAKFFNRKRAMKTFILSSLIYPFFSSAVAIYSLFSGYQWKGRYFKK